MKDHETLIAAARKSPGWLFVALGTGTERLATPENVIGLGRREDVAAFAQAADVILSTSAFGEGFSNALAEGMSAGLIPVATDVGDAGRIAGDTGWIVRPRDPAAISEALAAVAALPDVEAGNRRVASRARIESAFSVGGMAARYDRLHREGTL